MTVYSPYQTQLHLECQVKRLVLKEGWVPRQIEQRDISAILGVAVAKGLEVYNKGGGAEAARAAAFSEASQRQADAITIGRTLPAHHQSQWDRVAARAEAAVNAYTEWPDPLPGKIVAVEEPYGPEGGYARPDLIVDDGRAPRVPFDYKVTLSLGRTVADREKNKTRRIGQWSRSFQLLMYAWREQVLHYYIGFMVLEPEFSFETLEFQVHPETMELWAAGAEQAWFDMKQIDDAGETMMWRRPTMSASHADEFGDCPYQWACFEHHLDPVLMAQDYVRVVR